MRRGLALAVCIAATIATPAGAHRAEIGSANAGELASVLVPSASAAPDREATVSATAATYEWDGGPLTGYFVTNFIGSGENCTKPRCDATLIKVDIPAGSTGDLKVDIGDFDSEWDLDLYVFASDAQGRPLKPLGVGERPAGEPETSTVSRAAPGYYLIQVVGWNAAGAFYKGKVNLSGVGPASAPAPQEIKVEGCNFTLYHFKDSAERLQAYVPPGYRVYPYQPYLAGTGGGEKGTATVAAAVYDCDRVEVPGSSPAPGIFSLLSVVVYSAEGAIEGPATADFYVLWVHADNPPLVELLASAGMPAYLVPGMLFEKPAQSLAVRAEVPWSQGAYELETSGALQDPFHRHANSYWHNAADGRIARLDFVTNPARDQYCSERSPDDAPCGKLTAQAGTPVAAFFGAPERTPDIAWDHDPVPRAWFDLSVSPPAQPPPGDPNDPGSGGQGGGQQGGGEQGSGQRAPGRPGGHRPSGTLLPAFGKLTVAVAADKGRRKTVRKRGFRVRVRCSVQCNATVTATVNKKTARKLRLGRKAVKLGTGKASITKAGRIPFYARLTRKAKKALGRKRAPKFAVKLVVTVKDRQGGQLKRFTKTVKPR